MYLNTFSLFMIVVVSVIICGASANNANNKLKKCCAKLPALGDDKECIDRFCDFNSISQTNVLNFLSTCTERGDTVGHMWDCASSRVDHTACCEAKNVDKKCMPYCKANNGVPINYLNYLFCLETFNEIRDCFKDHLEKN